MSAKDKCGECGKPFAEHFDGCDCRAWRIAHTVVDNCAGEEGKHCEKHPRYVNWPFCPDCRSESEPLVGLSGVHIWPNGKPEAPIERALATQVGGGHYKDMPIQPVEYIYKNSIGYFEGCVIKYVSRWKKKNGVEDLKKARHFLDLLIEMEEGKV